MTRRMFCLFAFALLFGAFAPNQLLACGETTKKVCCKAPAPHKSATFCYQEHTAQKGNCPCRHARGGCHCPNSGCVVSSSAAAFLVEIPALPAYPTITATLRQQAFYFAARQPQAVYLPIWQPPKWGA